MKVGIIGAGAYGGALSKILRANGNATKFFDPWKFPERRLDEVLDWAEAVLLAVPASAVAKLLRQFPVEARRKPLIVATKGVMDLSVYRGFEHVELISGPGFASEILSGKKIKLTVATVGESYAEELFGGEQVNFDKTEDVKGVAMLSGLKNIYAIEAGRRRLGANTEEFKEYIYDALKEAEKFLLYNGGFLETTRLNAGVGDFVLTCGSMESRNYQFGESFDKRFLKNKTVEGIHAAEEIRRLGLFVPRELEILPDVLRRIYGVK